MKRGLDFEQRLDEYLGDEMRRKHIPGLSVAVIQNGRALLEKSYGLANVELQTPAASTTVYEIGSITKSFTAVAMLMLAEAGYLHLDDPLTRFRAGLPMDWGAITLRHLLTHTSGIPEWTLDWGRSDITPDIVYEAIFGPALRFTPGAQLDITDANYNLLGMVVHQVTGAPYDVFLRDQIFIPLGMTATRHNDVRTIVPNRAAGYDWSGAALVNADRIRWNHLNLAADLPANGANGSLLSTLPDMIAWDAALTADRLLSPAVGAQMWMPARLADGAEASAGFGCELLMIHGHRLAALDGGVPGFTTSLSRFLDDHLTIILLTNQDSKPWDMCQVIAGLVTPALAGRPGSS